MIKMHSAISVHILSVKRCCANLLRLGQTGHGQSCWKWPLNLLRNYLSFIDPQYSGVWLAVMQFCQSAPQVSFPIQYRFWMARERPQLQQHLHLHWKQNCQWPFRCPRWILILDNYSTKKLGQKGVYVKGAVCVQKRKRSFFVILVQSRNRFFLQNNEETYLQNVHRLLKFCFVLCLRTVRRPQNGKVSWPNASKQFVYLEPCRRNMDVIILTENASSHYAMRCAQQMLQGMGCAVVKIQHAIWAIARRQRILVAVTFLERQTPTAECAVPMCLSSLLNVVSWHLMSRGPDSPCSEHAFPGTWSVFPAKRRWLFQEKEPRSSKWRERMKTISTGAQSR